MVGKRGLCCQCPMVLDGLRQLQYGEIMLNVMLKIVQRQGIGVELPLHIGAHRLFHLQV